MPARPPGSRTVSRSAGSPSSARRSPPPTRTRSREELRVEDVRFEAGEAARVRFKPNLPVLGPRLGKQLPAIRAALESGDYELDGDVVVVEGERLSGDDLLRERTPVHEGWHVAAEGRRASRSILRSTRACVRRGASTS